MKARVVFIGPMASGKTKIAKRVASLMGASRLDTDKMIVAEHGPIAEIFTAKGEPFFRSCEEDAVTRALDEAEVVSLGGGAVLSGRTQQLLRRAHVVYLTVSPDAVAHRLAGGKRPLLADGMQSWNRIFEERKHLYEDLADITFDTSHGRLDDIAASVVAWIKSDYSLSADGEPS